MKKHFVKIKTISKTMIRKVQKSRGVNEENPKETGGATSFKDLMYFEPYMAFNKLSIQLLFSGE